MTALISKPGITSANAAISIPTDWSATWFKNFVSNYLKGADVRNAVGSGGITVSGTIASPYATIGLGPTVPGNLTFTGNDSFTGNNTFGPGSSTFTGDVIIAPTSGTPLIVKSNGGVTVFEVTGTITSPVIEAYGPTAGGLVDMTPDTGTFTVTLTGTSSATTGTAIWVRQGKTVNIWLPSLVGTSNTTACTLTGIPTGLQPPSITQNFLALIENNSASAVGLIQVAAASGTWTVFNSIPPTATFTASGSKGVPDGASLTYQLN